MVPYIFDFDESELLLSESIGHLSGGSPFFNTQLDYAYYESTGWYFQGIVEGLGCPDCFEGDLSIWRDRENRYSPGSFWHSIYACTGAYCGKIFPKYGLDIFRRLILGVYTPEDHLRYEEKLHIAAKNLERYSEKGVNNRPWSKSESESFRIDVETGTFSLNELSDKYLRTFQAIRTKINKVRFPSMGRKWSLEEEFIIEESYLSGDDVITISQATKRTPDSIYRKIKTLQEISIDAHSDFKPSEMAYLIKHLATNPSHLYDASLRLGRPIAMLEGVALNSAIEKFPSAQLEPKEIAVTEPSEFHYFSKDERAFPLAIAIYTKLGFIPILEDDSPFKTDGWEYEGSCKDIPCARCGSVAGLEIWRKEIENSKYRFWGIACSECETLSNMMDYPNELRKRFREWSSEISALGNSENRFKPKSEKYPDFKRVAEEFLILDNLSREFNKSRPDGIRKLSSTVNGHIKDTLKVYFGIDFCFIQNGSFFNVIEENALIANELWNWKIHNKTKKIPMAGTSSLSDVKSKAEELDNKEITWAIVETIQEGPEDKVRIVTDSSEEQAVGFKNFG